MSAATRIPCEHPDSCEPIFPETLFPGEESTVSAFHSFFDKAPIGIVRCNQEGLVLQMNVEFERRLGELALRKPLCLLDLVVPQDRDKTEFLLREVVESGRDGMRLCVHFAGPGQEASNWIAWPASGARGEQEAALILAQAGQRTESELCAEGLLRAQRWEAIGRLTGGVAHDFNNLLTGVMLYCDLLLSALDARDLRRRYAEEIRSAIIPASALVRQLLVFARPQQPDPYPVSVNEIAENMRNLLMRLLGENVNLELSLDPRLGPVTISRSQAQQILLNLVLNARDALPEGGRIRIETSNAVFQPVDGRTPKLENKIGNPGLPCVLVSVTDNGRGMDAGTRRRLFEPFFTTKADKGTGLGLTTVESIVTAHRGLVHFESQPGVGTCAMILLPRAECSETHPSIAHRLGVQIASEIPSQDLKKESHL
jgi:signal transduction histidine kinase